mmetsp:Transcript_16234/g.51009  ORF Transcript_16234/g.51009 Transcript_16234/m.51009 type:complete len:290 (+) Transcript_16234:424-1293(+)
MLMRGLRGRQYSTGFRLHPYLSSLLPRPPPQLLPPPPPPRPPPRPPPPMRPLGPRRMPRRSPPPWPPRPLRPVCSALGGTGLQGSAPPSPTVWAHAVWTTGSAQHRRALPTSTVPATPRRFVTRTTASRTLDVMSSTRRCATPRAEGRASDPYPAPVARQIARAGWRGTCASSWGLLTTTRSVTGATAIRTWAARSAAAAPGPPPLRPLLRPRLPPPTPPRRPRRLSPPRRMRGLPGRGSPRVRLILRCRRSRGSATWQSPPTSSRLWTAWLPPIPSSLQTHATWRTRS